MTGRIAVVGASGFVGNRTVEMLHLDGVDVLPIVREASRSALAARFDLPIAVADALDESALGAAFEGCDSAVIAIAGDPRTIVDTVAPVYRAAERARLRRIVHLSTASVHGQAPAEGTDEATPLSDRQRLAYNNAKVRAERALQRHRDAGTTEIVMLRPGIVYGPRSQWTGGLADQLLAGEASLVDGGHGICNGIYVDNVVHAIRLALTADGADRQAFLIGDRETITWLDLYRPVATALGIDVDRLPTPSSSGIDGREPWSVRLRRSSTARRVLPAPVRAGLAAAWNSARGAAPRRPTEPQVTLEQALLHTCSVKLPWSKAHAVLGYEPVVSFEEGCRRSVAWLDFAGYPVRRPAT